LRAHARQPHAGASVAGAGGDTRRANARVDRDRSTRARGTAGRNRVRPTRLIVHVVEGRGS